MIELEYYNTEHGTAKSLFELEIKIDEAISGLPDQCKKVFELSRQRGFKNREIAEELNISVSVVEKHISKALHKLREALKDYLILILIFKKLF